MARLNKKGTSFMGLGLEEHEEKALLEYLKDKDQSAKRLIRFLIRKHLKEQKYV